MQQSPIILTLALCLWAAPARGQQPLPPAPKRASATRVDAGAISVDGRLSEEVWQSAPPITDFVQKEPTQGAAPTDEMEVRFAYDDRAFYVGARMYSRNARGIQAPLGRRDVVDQAERILVSLDTFLDRRTSVVLGVTAAGVRLDRFHATDIEETFDATYDLVWDAATTMDDDGWTAEIWIPFAQLRFNPESRPDLGPQRPALPADAQRGRHLGADPPHGAGLGVAVRRPARHLRRARRRGASSCCRTWPARPRCIPAPTTPIRSGGAPTSARRVPAPT